MIRKALSAAGAGLKAFRMRFGAGTGAFWGFVLPRSRFNYANEVGDGTRNSAVMACVDWLARNFPEAPFWVTKRNPDRQWQENPDDPLTELIERPNPFYPGVILWMATTVALAIHGDAYWIVECAGDGRPVRLWWCPTWLIEPKWDNDGTSFISHYEYSPGYGAPVRLETAENHRGSNAFVVHFRWGLDPINPRKGLSPLASLLREIFTDDEAANYTASILRNLGVPGIIITPDGDNEPTPEDAQTIREDFTSKFSGDGRGQPMILSGKSKITTVSFSPQEMNLREIRRIPEERITARLGVPAVVVGLGAGLDRSTYSNMEEARAAAFENGIIPMQRLLTAQLDVQLLPEFHDGQGWRTGFDIKQVRVLQDDQYKLFQRVDLAVKGGWALVAEARSAVGLPVDPSHQIYLRTISVIEVPAGEMGRTLSPGSPAAALLEEDAAKARRTAVTIKAGERQRETRERAIRLAQRQLARFFAAQAERVASRLSTQKAIAKNGAQVKQGENLLPATELAQLQELLGGIQLSALDRGWTAAQEAIGLAAPFDAGSPISLVLQSRLGENITKIDETTRADVAAHVLRGEAAGYTPAQIAAGVPADGFPGLADVFAFSDERALLIARTELTTAENWSAAASWRESGVVKAVRILDGDGCGWTEHDDPDLAHDTVRALDDFEAHPLAHPNCVRVPTAILE